MIEKNEVKESLKAAFGIDDDELDGKDKVISFAVNYAEGITGKCGEEDRERLVFLAAAKANLYIAQLEEEDGVTSFKAGDVSFEKTSGGRVAAAEKMLEDALESCGDLIENTGFVFRTVG